jgi:hypothetical protein
VIDQDRPVTVFSAIHTSVLEGEVVLFDARRGQFFSLDPPAGRLWQLIQRQYTIRQIIDYLIDAGEIAEARRFIDLLSGWRARGLIRLPQTEEATAARL